MDWNAIRLAAHLALFWWCVTASYLLILARGRAIAIVHVPLAVASLTLLALWMLGLVFSIRDMGIISRQALVPVLGSLELASGVMAWAWLVAYYRRSFRLKVNVRQTLDAVIIAMTMMLVRK